MGTGIFNLPFRVSQLGILSYIFLLLIAGIFSYLGMYLISRLILRFNVVSYSTMSELAYGKTFRKVAEFCLILYPWGATICFQVLFAKFVIQLLADNFGLALYEGDKGRDT
jgi:amino acid permease